MIVNIVLEHPHEHYTNLDLIQGKVFLRVPNPANVSSIIVKLEGEGRTRLLAPIHPSRPDKQRPVLEVHKFLYQTQVLYPPNTRQEDLAQNPKTVYPLNAGSFEYPFQFKVGHPVLAATTCTADSNNSSRSTPNANSRTTPSLIFPSRTRYPSLQKHRHNTSKQHFRQRSVASQARQRSDTLSR